MTQANQQRTSLRAVDPAQQQQILVRAPERVCDVLAEQVREDRVAGLLPAQGIVVLFGDANAGKTFFLLDLCAHIAAGRDFVGRRVLQGGVLYVSAEGNGGFTKRLRALALKHPNLPSLPFRIIRQAINLREWGADLLMRGRDIEEDSGPLGLVVIDTLSQTIWGDENNNQDMAAYVRAAGVLSDQLRCPVVIGHHGGKDVARGMRGSSALRGNVDVVIHLKADSEGNRVASTDPAGGGKVRDDEVTTIGFRLVAVPVGTDVGGNQLTSCYVEYQDAQIAQGNAVYRPGAAGRLLLELAGNLARASRRYREDGTPLIARRDLEVAWAQSKKATQQPKQASPSYMSRPLADLVANGRLITQDGSDLWFPR